MKINFNHLLIYTFFALIFFTACQDETTEINNPEEQEMIVADSQLARFMGNVTANYGEYDNFLDESSCFSLELPVTIIIGDITIVIETLDDLDEVEDLFSQYENEEDFFDFVFPLTIIFNDYTPVIIENAEQLENFIANCEIEEDEVIECVDFVYPISFSVFNANFNIIDTVIIESDEALYNFLEELSDDDNALVVGLNYPVTLVYANGETVEVNSNQELSDAIEAAEMDCEDNVEECDINLQELENILLECGFDAEFYNTNGNLTNTLQLQFNASGTVTATGDPTVVETGEWDIIETELGYKLVIEGFETFGLANGLWLLTDCEGNGLDFTKETNEGLVTMRLELNCDIGEDVFNCFGDFEIEECLGPNNEAEFNLGASTIGLVDCPFSFFASFHVTEADAQANLNAIADSESYWSSTGQVYLRIESETGNYEIFTIYLIAQECNNVLGCLQTTDIVLCDENNDGIENFNLYEGLYEVENCVVTDPVNVSYHETLADAENATNPLPEVTSYSNVTNPQTVYVRIEVVADPNIFEVLEMGLYLEDCNPSGCTEEDVDSFLVTCIWNAVNFNGSDNLMNWNFDFEPNSQTVVIYNNESTIDATWTTSQTDEGVIVTFTNVAGPNIQAITGEWLVLECEENRLQLIRDNDFLVLERTCE